MAGDESGNAAREFRVAVLDDYLRVAESLADWSALPAGTRVDFLSEVIPPERVVETLAPYDALVVMRERTPLPAQVLDALPRLTLIVTTGKSNASIDLPVAAQNGVIVSGTAGLASPTVELTWALILGLVRHVPLNDATVHSGGWQTALGVGLEGRTLGIVGLGRLGTRVATIARTFGMDVAAWSPHLDADRAAAAGARLVSKDELFRTSDIVTLHLALAESTRGIIGEPELRAMARHALFVNTSRAGLVDGAALRAALEESRIAGAALDVFEEEPLPADAWQRTARNVLLSPHTGYVTEQNFKAMYADAVEDVAAYLSGAPVRVIGQPA